MSKVYENITELIGKTPLLALNRIKERFRVRGNIYAKLENFNPGGSIKDRVALKMLEEAKLIGLVTEGTTVIEASSGNTGIGLAMVCASQGYKLIVVMPDSMSLERRYLLRAYGVKLVITPAEEGMEGALRRVEELAEEIRGSFVPNQFFNSNNPFVHYTATANEIYKDLGGAVDIIVCGIGSGGTISGVGEHFKERKPDVKIIGVEPESSPLLTEGWAGKHLIQGIGPEFVPHILNRKVIDEIFTVSDEKAYEYTHIIAREEGLVVGISSGAILAAAIEVAIKYPDQNIVVIFPDSGDRYLSTGVFNNKDLSI